jgi:hypothetical protein
MGATENTASASEGSIHTNRFCIERLLNQNLEIKTLIAAIVTHCTQFGNAHMRAHSGF